MSEKTTGVTGEATTLFDAARSGDAGAARRLLLAEAGAEVDARHGAMGVTALMAAAQRGDAPVVRLLLEAGADPNAVGRNGAGALARAAVAGDAVETARLLLDAGADPNGGSSDAPPNATPLWAAVALKRRGLVGLLLERGANPNIGDSTTDTPFGVAATGGDAEIARRLLEAGADPLRPARANLPLLAVSLRFSNPPMAALLEEHGLS
ncbi:MAG TPA: ankyrin repeat domain-containing protein, partial [Armatimonadaceae bacterium]|nr:ankyrin repeat domain-containing protein [Armatimonadaceae bacterium]